MQTIDKRNLYINISKLLKLGIAQKGAECVIK